MLDGRVCAEACWMALIAEPSDAPGARSNEIVIDGSWPEWLTVTGPTSLWNDATELRGTRAAPVLGATLVPTLPGVAAPLPAPSVPGRSQSEPSDAMSCWYCGRTSMTTQYSFVGV